MAQAEDSTHLDIKLFRADQGGDPDLVRKSQTRRFKDVGLVDAVIELDKTWRAGIWIKFVGMTPTPFSSRLPNSRTAHRG